MIAEFISPETLGFILIAVMLFAIFIGFPISFTLIYQILDIQIQILEKLK